MARRSVGRSSYYSSVEAILEAGGHPGILESTDHQEEAEAWARECALRYEPGRLRSTRAFNHRERADAKRISRLRSARAGKGGRAAFYEWVEAIFAAAGHRGIFAAVDSRAEAEAWARAFVRRYPPGRLPRHDASDPRERSDYSRLRNLVNARKGTNRGTYYPSVGRILEAAGHTGLFGPD